MWNASAKNPPKYIAAGLCFGVAFGAAIGVALGNVAYGMGPGIALGVAIGAVLQKRAASQFPAEEPGGDGDGA